MIWQNDCTYQFTPVGDSPIFLHTHNWNQEDLTQNGPNLSEYKVTDFSHHNIIGHFLALILIYLSWCCAASSLSNMLTQAGKTSDVNHEILPPSRKNWNCIAFCLLLPWDKCFIIVPSYHINNNIDIMNGQRCLHHCIIMLLLENKHASNDFQKTGWSLPVPSTCILLLDN